MPTVTACKQLPRFTRAEAFHGLTRSQPHRNKSRILKPKFFTKRDQSMVLHIFVLPCRHFNHWICRYHTTVPFLIASEKFGGWKRRVRCDQRRLTRVFPFRVRSVDRRRDSGSAPHSLSNDQRAHRRTRNSPCRDDVWSHDRSSDRNSCHSSSLH